MLRTKKQKEIDQYTLEVVRRVMVNIRTRLEECLRRDGGHLEEIIFKKQTVYNIMYFILLH